MEVLLAMKSDQPQCIVHGIVGTMYAHRGVVLIPKLVWQFKPI